MQNKRGSGDSRDLFGIFGGFGNFGDFGGSIFGRNPFDDPFFRRPFRSMLDQRPPTSDILPVNPPNEPIIRELTSDDEGEGGEAIDKGKESQKGALPNNEPFIDHPDDEIDGNIEHANNRTDSNRAEGRQNQSFKVHSCKVTYGGIDGVYYSSSATRRMGNDGVIMEECKEADKTTGEATHRVSRGLHDKGHSLTRKLNSDGKVETLHKLHNIKEDELGSFEESWKGNVGMHQPHWTGSSSSQVDRTSNQGGFFLPSARDTRGRQPVNDNRGDLSGGRTKKVVRIPID